MFSASSSSPAADRSFGARSGASLLLAGRGLSSCVTAELQMLDSYASWQCAETELLPLHGRACNAHTMCTWLSRLLA